MNPTPAAKPAPKSTPADQFVRIENVVKKFGESVAVNNVSLNVAKNELFALLGSSGCGKSTLLRMLAGLETATSGRIFVDGEDLAALPPYRRPVNMMFQSYALFPHMSVEANVAFGLKQEGTPKNEIRERVADALHLVQMDRYAKRKPHQLSGGQQQRVALARSLVKRPKLLLLDEPMSALDKKIRQKTQLELVNIIDKVDVTCVMVTHDQEEAMTMANRLAVMSEGSIVQIGSPSQVYEYPNSRFSAEFIGSTNLFEGHVVEDEPDHIFVESADLEARMYVSHGITGPLGMPVGISVRPERVRVTRERPASPHNWARGIVTDVAYMGSYSLFHVRLPGGKVVMSNLSSSDLMADNAPAWNDDVYVSWSPASGVVLTQ
ncbi:ABC transporter ATP-binding protein [Paraburkholderia caballeronis]|uniref:Spermidine/putrescine import ATP-binding protein PotA n=1 Tax=Paraburkholderia caballeronis TaxID=416943 RepID=A0A1H7GDH5_9BURK|nr:polyamine ABC transporter ATP-binding protein [Paraburkholderia caballeronis]PXW24683.1 spermidine/putrescine ABC transporter ATP-binding subunit [Paraburkholderia caballeronis]PXX00413.1 spermidine/putrescine ABC transporter ATP-binding subunit [Paraburkholderia caballeronis]RAJ98476.1 spermidine/putrescine ABC transporter ATP-binding subunit [Paraburkholderia caballeronis]TDV16703.1 spermidine/putrescine ABC transporter ATP-binding subunit [Paraburkholderia caballeronis]TDV19099.1 spermid